MSTRLTALIVVRIPYEDEPMASDQLLGTGRRVIDTLAQRIRSDVELMQLLVQTFDAQGRIGRIDVDVSYG